MLLQVMSIRDAAANAYMRPMFVPTAGMAVRAFQDEAQREGSEVAKHPEDYELFCLASFDEETGQFTNLHVPKSFGRAVDYCKE